MKKFFLGKSDLLVPATAVGCMRICGMDPADIPAHLSFCIENGLNFFDHADIYAGGYCETLFHEAFQKTGFRREDIILQSKCGIVSGKMYDFSKQHILESVDGSLKRLGTDYLDVLVLHRPDALCEPEEVAAAFDELESAGKVRHFGVSNHRPSQIELLKKCVRQEIVTDQLQFSLPFSSMIAAGMEANMLTDGALDRDGGVLDYCRLKDITIQAWSPFQYGFFEGAFVGNYDKYPKLNQTLSELSAQYDATPTALAIAWILRHPANIQVIVGSTNTERIREILLGNEIVLSREDWYRLYLSAGHLLP